jgi:heat shock protein HslJ
MRTAFALAPMTLLVCFGAFPQAQVTVTGGLSRTVAIGGESTGWSIRLDTKATVEGKTLSSIEVADGGQDKLHQLANKHVKATGKIVHRQGVETGDRLILEISQIEEASGGAEEAPTSSKPSSSRTLIGSEWVLEDIGWRPALDTVQATISFPGSGKVAGRGSCNRFFGSVQMDAGTMEIGPLGLTRMACPAPVLDQETRYLNALRAAERYEIRNSELLIFSKGLDKPVRFKKAQAAK